MSDETKKGTANAQQQGPELSKDELNKATGGEFNGFVNFGDIKGESTDKDHKDWVTILKFDH